MTETEQEMRNKVINGLEIHLKGNSRCAGCPYPNNGMCGDQLFRDALDLLKAQQARVMTLEEVKTSEGSDVWLELSRKIGADALTAATIYECGAKGICTFYQSYRYDKYGIRPYGWRLWTAKPTKEQRKAAKWNGI